MRLIRTIPAILWMALFLIGLNAAAGDDDAFNRGLQLLEQQRYDEAINAFSMAIEVIPGDYQAYNSRGVARALKGDFDGAIEDYRKALEIRPRYAEAYNNRGYARTEKGQLRAALDDYDKALKINPAFVDAYNSRAWILATTGDKDLRNSAEAILLAQKAVELDPSVASLDTLAAAYAAADKYEAAIETQKKAIQKLILADRTSEVPKYMDHLDIYRSRHSLRIDYSTAPEVSGSRASTISLNTKSEPQPAPPAETKKMAEAPDVRPAAASSKTKIINPLESKSPATPCPYTIQVSAFRSLQVSNQVAAELQTRGDRAFTCPIEISDKGKWNRVYIGNYRTLAEANTAASGLKKRNFRYVHVTKAPYAVQVGLADSAQEAQKIKSRLRENEYLAYTLPAESGQNRIRILVGAYENAKAAEQLADQLKKDGFNPKIDLR
jgi:tetratricopeptide (TPR) repeat protein